MENKGPCSINVERLLPEFPLMNSVENPTKFLYPGEKGRITLAPGDAVRLSCSSNNYFVRFPKVTTANVTCHKGEKFWFHTTLLNFYTLKCREIPQYEARDKELNDAKPSNIKKRNISSEYEIGFLRDDQRTFIKAVDFEYCEKLDSRMYIMDSNVSKSLMGEDKLELKLMQFHRYTNINHILDEETETRSSLKQTHKHTFSNTNNGYTARSAPNYSSTYGRLTAEASISCSAAAPYICSNTGPNMKRNNEAVIKNYSTDTRKNEEKDLLVFADVDDTLDLSTYEESTCHTKYSLTDEYAHNRNQSRCFLYV